MDYVYIKAVHIIFIVTWFAGLFYMPRLYIYFIEAGNKPHVERDILQAQFKVMMRRLWYGITWPSAMITLVMGIAVLVSGGWWGRMLAGEADWLIVKLIFVLLLYGYHLSLHVLFRRLYLTSYDYTSTQLRVWNEVATVFLVAIVLLATVKNAMSFVWGLAALLVFIGILLAAVHIYKRFRRRTHS